jgi:hypothetical protein
VRQSNWTLFSGASCLNEEGGLRKIIGALPRAVLPCSHNDGLWLALLLALSTANGFLKPLKWPSQAENAIPLLPNPNGWL